MFTGVPSKAGSPDVENMSSAGYFEKFLYLTSGRSNRTPYDLIEPEVEKKIKQTIINNNIISSIDLAVKQNSLLIVSIRC